MSNGDVLASFQSRASMNDEALRVIGIAYVRIHVGWSVGRSTMSSGDGLVSFQIISSVEKDGVDGDWDSSFENTNWVV